MAEKPEKMKHGNISDVAAQHYDEVHNPPPRILTGFRELDEAMSGIRAGDYAIIAGSTGDFKSTLCTNIYLNCVRQEIPIALYGYEMANVQTFRRMLCNELDLPLSILESNEVDLTKEQKKQVRDKIKELEEKHIYLIDENVDLLEDLLGDIVLKSQDGVKVFIVDYVQLLNVHRGGNRVEQIETISRQLRNCARTNKVTIIGISQLSREHKKTGKPPDLHDLKGSGGLENDATQVVFIETKQYHKMMRDLGLEHKGMYIPAYREASLSLLKNRHGVSGMSSLCGIVPKYYKIINIAPGDGISPDTISHKCSSCGSTSFIYSRGRCLCDNCGKLMEPLCACKDGIKFYSKKHFGVDYLYVGLCSECPRGLAIHTSVQATNGLLVQKGAPAIGNLPFIDSSGPQLSAPIGDI